MSRPALLSAGLLSSLAMSVEANPIASPFDYAFEIALFNLPVNGLILLVVYVSLLRRGAIVGYFSPNDHFLVFISSTAIISFTGGIVDSVAFTTDSIPIFLAATALIGFIAGIVALRYLKLDREATFIVGTVFFIVNIVSWSLLETEIVVWMHRYCCLGFWVVILVYIIVLFMVTRNVWRIPPDAVDRPAPRTGWAHGDPSTPSQHPVHGDSAPPEDANANLVVESVITATCCIYLMFPLYILWVS